MCKVRAYTEDLDASIAASTTNFTITGDDGSVVSGSLYSTPINPTTTMDAQTYACVAVDQCYSLALTGVGYSADTYAIDYSFVDPFGSEYSSTPSGGGCVPPAARGARAARALSLVDAHARARAAFVVSRANI